MVRVFCCVERLFDAKKQNLLLALDGHLRTEEATTKEVSSDAACPSTDVAGNRCCVPLDQVSRSQRLYYGL